MSSVIRMSPMSGTVTHPADLGPAIAKLGKVGKAWLDRRTEGREVRPRDIAKAADFERGELRSSDPQDIATSAYFGELNE